MKKLLLILALAISLFDIKAQKIEYLNTGIFISADVADGISNNIRYSITIPIEQIETAISVLPQVNGSQLIDGTFKYGSVVICPNMPQIKATMEIEASDVGKKVDNAECIWLTNIIYQTNLLNLDLSKWTLKTN